MSRRWLEVYPTTAPHYGHHAVDCPADSTHRNRPGLYKAADLWCRTGSSCGFLYFRLGGFAVSRQDWSSGVMSSAWLPPSACPRWYSVTTVGLRRPRSRPLTYCCVNPESSAKRSWVKPFASRSLAKFRPTSLRMSMRQEDVVANRWICSLDRPVVALRWTSPQSRTFPWLNRRSIRRWPIRPQTPRL